MIALHILASGSSGNAALLRIGEQRLLLDAGLGYRRLHEALTAAGASLDAVDAVFITHEHRDHTSALPLLVKRHPGIPVFASAGTMEGWARSYGWSFGARALKAGQPLRLGDTRVLPFATRHDAREPLGLRVEWRGGALGLATDLGSWDRTVCEALTDCQALLLESNYDPTRLAYGSYPEHLKRRVASCRGHLSNGQAGALLRRVVGPRLRHVALVHLSHENNAPETALEVVAPALASLPHVSLLAASRHTPTAPIALEPGLPLRRPRRSGAQQLALPL
jgi:phosphoribosyl 1,2-cyclic phosphodiesterase